MSPPVPFGEAARAWAEIAVNSFGGPAGQIAVMHRVLVEERKWIGEERFLHALNYCMLLPGPEAQQLVTYTGWLMHGTVGGLVAGSLFVMPGFFSILWLSLMYAWWHTIPVVAAALVGVKASVLSVVVEAMLRIGKRVLSDRATVAVAVAGFVALFFLQVPFPLVILAAGALGFALPGVFPPAKPPVPKDGATPVVPVIDAALDADALPWVHPRPARDLGLVALLGALWLAPTLALAALVGPDSTWTEVSVFFSQSALVTFGGAYAVLAYVAQQAVDVHGWLTAGEMLDGLGLAETTPGPLIQVVQFVGFLATSRDPGALTPTQAGVLGSILVTWVTFLPSFVFVLGGAPYVERVRKVSALASALRAITSAVVGVIGNLAVWLALHVLFGTVNETHLGPVRVVWPDPASVHPWAVVIALGAGLALLRFHVGMIPVLFVSAALGALGFWLGWA